MAAWDASGALTLYETTQHIFGTRELVSIVLGVPREKINVVSHFLGGGFGGKAYVWPHTLLAAIAARVVNRPVRVQLTRAQMYSMVGHQPATIQTIALGADRDGKLTGIRHESISPTPVFDNYIEYAANASRSLVGAPARHRDEPQGRACEPQHADRDALAARGARPFRARERYGRTRLRGRRRSCRIAPAQRHRHRPATAAALSPRVRLRKCLTEGARRFGWDKRKPEPRSMRDGRYLVGQGVAAAIYTHWRWPAKARVTLRARWFGAGRAGMHEIGTGTYTVMRQVAADALGLAPEKVTVRLGDTRLPASHAAIGSSTMANAGLRSCWRPTPCATRPSARAARTGAPFADGVFQDVVAADGGLALREER